MINSLATVAQTKLVIRDLKGLEWEYDKRYSLLDSNEYFAYSFSVADVIDSTKTWQKLDKCNCIMDGDTVSIWIHNNFSEGGIAVSIALTKNSWKSFIQHYSDIQEFESGNYYSYEPEKSTLFVNLPNYNIGDVLVGSIDITAVKLETLELGKLTLKGKFQCIIMEKQRR